VPPHSPLPPAAPPDPPSPPLLPGLFCFVVIAREFGDVPRARNILDISEDAGFGGCDVWRIYSNVTAIPSLSDHPRCSSCVEQAVQGSMDVPKGIPSWGWWLPTALNTPVFQQVWRHVFATAPYRDWAWTVKTEVDVVFAASHLRAYLMATRLEHQIAVANQYGDQDETGHRGMGLHGPIEALTTHAMSTFAAGLDVCARVADRNPLKGEDWWLNLCMQELGVDIRILPDMLADEGSSGGLDVNHTFWPCSGHHVAYHPRVTVELWNDCFWQQVGCAKIFSRGSKKRVNFYDSQGFWTEAPQVDLGWFDHYQRPVEEGEPLARPLGFQEGGLVPIRNPCDEEKMLSLESPNCYDAPLMGSEQLDGSERESFFCCCGLYPGQWHEEDKEE
jgi:hypothetical protein